MVLLPMMDWRIGPRTPFRWHQGRHIAFALLATYFNFTNSKTKIDHTAKVTGN